MFGGLEVLVPVAIAAYACLGAARWFFKMTGYAILCSIGVEDKSKSISNFRVLV